MFSENKMANGPGFIVLNIIRVLNIISLLLIVGASWIMLVMTVKTSNFFFFDGVSHFITSTIGLFLIISECSLFRTYFSRSWPMLSPEFGFTFLGLSMIVLGFNILGNLNKSATSVENLGLPMWRVVISGGIMTSLMGFFNIVATFIFCDSALGITGRQVRTHGAQVPKDTLKPFSISGGLPSLRRSNSAAQTLPMYTTTITSSNSQSRSNPNRKSNRFGFKLPTRTSFFPPKISAPFVPASSPPRHNFTIDNNNDNETEVASSHGFEFGTGNGSTKWESEGQAQGSYGYGGMGRELANPNDRSSPVAPDVQRPPTALHPAFAPRVPAAPSSRYSEVSNMTRF